MYGTPCQMYSYSDSLSVETSLLFSIQCMSFRMCLDCLSTAHVCSYFALRLNSFPGRKLSTSYTVTMFRLVVSLLGHILSQSVRVRPSQSPGLPSQFCSKSGVHDQSELLHPPPHRRTGLELVVRSGLSDREDRNDRQ